MMLDRVLEPCLTRGHDRGRRGRIVRGDEPDLGLRLRRGVDQHEPAAARAVDGDVEPLVVFLEDEDVGGSFGAQLVPPHLPRPHRVVEPDVEARARVVGPGEAVRHVVDDIGEVAASRQVAKVQRVALAARGVDRVRDHRVVGGDGETSEREVGVALCLDVLVEQYLLLPAAPGPPRVDRVLEAFDSTGDVFPVVARDGRGDVGLLDPGLDLAEDPLTKFVRRGEHARGVRILCFQMGANRGVVALSEPEPVVDARIAVFGQCHGPAFRRGRSRGHGGAV